MKLICCAPRPHRAAFTATPPDPCSSTHPPHDQGASLTALTDLYGSGAYFMMANAGQMSRREAARMYAADRGWD